MKVNN